MNTEEEAANFIYRDPTYSLKLGDQLCLLKEFKEVEKTTRDD